MHTKYVERIVRMISNKNEFPNHVTMDFFKTYCTQAALTGQNWNAERSGLFLETLGTNRVVGQKSRECRNLIQHHQNILRYFFQQPELSAIPTCDLCVGSFTCEYIYLYALHE